MKSIYMMLVRFGGSIFKVNSEPESGYFLQFANDANGRVYFLSNSTFDLLSAAGYLTRTDPNVDHWLPNLENADANTPIIPAGDFIAYMNQQVPADVDLSLPVSNSFNRVHAISIFDAFRRAFESKEHLIAGYDVVADPQEIIKELSAMLAIYYSQEEIRQRYEQMDRSSK